MSVKKKVIITVCLLIIAAVILCVPFHVAHLNDGGTVIYSAPLVKIVKWFHLGENNNFETGYYSTSVYFFPDSIKDINELELELEDELKYDK